MILDNITAAPLNDLYAWTAQHSNLTGASLAPYGNTTNGYNFEEMDGQEDLMLLQRQLATVRVAIHHAIVPIVLLLGLAGNILNITVLTRRWMRSSTNYYLTSLAVCDIFYLAFGFTMSFKHYVSLKEMYFIWVPYGKPLVDIFSNSAVWLTLTFTVERYIAVCYPMKGKVLCTTKRARWIIFIVSLSATVITVPEFFELRTSYAVNSFSNETEAVGAPPTEFARTLPYSIYMMVTQILFTFLPLVLLSVFNTLLIRSVIKANRRRENMVKMAVVQNDKQDKYHKEQHRITVMLISVVIVFLVCQLPQAALNISNRLMEKTPRSKIHITIAANICNLLVQINSSVNFILYSSFSTKFRKTFKRLYCKCLRAKDRKDYLFSDISNAAPRPHDQNSTTNLLNTRGSNYHTHKNSPLKSPLYKPKVKNAHLAVPDVVDVFVSTV